MKLSTMLSAYAQRRPDRVAAVCEGKSITFREINEGGNRIANALLARGFKTGDRVVLYAPNSMAFYQAAAGIWKAGGVIVPVTTWLAPPEVKFIAEDCQPFALLYGPAQAEAVDAALAGLRGVARFELGGDDPSAPTAFEALIAEGGAEEPPHLPVQPDDAVIIYTSGTTGRPKGAVGTHANLLFQCMYTAMLWGMTGEDVFLVTTPLAHRVGFNRLVSTFVSGAKAVVLPRFDPPAAVAAIEEHGVTVMAGVPTVARMLVEYLEGTDHRCETLKAMTATGEPFPVAIKRRLAKRLPNLKLFSFYAMTEAGTPSGLDPDEPEAHAASAGKLLPGMEVRLIDDDWNDVPPGEPGEIAVRCGEPGRLAMMREYYNRPEANAAAFRDNWFRTGDVGRFDEEGYLYIVDRTKDMILSGGLNIYSQEVERALYAHPAIREVAVVAGPDADLGECVVAYAVLKPDATVSEDELIAHCRAEIASYKKPKHVFFVDALPRTASGKVRKPELRDRVSDDVTGAAG